VQARKGFNEEGQRLRLTELYQSFRTAGPNDEEYVAVVLQDPIDDTEKLSLAGATGTSEMDRRKQIKGTEFFVKVDIDGHELKDRSAMMAMPSNAESQIDFGGRFALAVSKTPQQLFAVIYESKGLLTKQVAKVPIEIPGSGTSVPQVETAAKTMEFSGGDPFERSVTLLKETADGGPVLAFEMEARQHYTSGELKLRVTWDTTALAALQGSSCAMPESDGSTPPVRAAPPAPLMLGGGINMDPNNPGNTGGPMSPSEVVVAPPIFEPQPTGEGAESVPQDEFFRLVNDDAELNFLKVDPEEDRRNQLLRLRDEGKVTMKDKDIDHVPMNPKDITDTMFDEGDADLFSWQKKKQRPKTLTAQQQKMQQLKQQAGVGLPTVRTREVATADMVNEPELPLFRVNFDWLFSLLAPRNPLRPRVVERKPKRGLTSTSIVIQVIGALNVPVRDTRRPGDDSTPSDAAREKAEKNVKPFVEVKFGKNEERTLAQWGNGPNWNATLHLPWEGPNVADENGELEFNLFDEVIVSVETDGASASLQSRRREKRWLASFNLPFQTVYRSMKINGTVPMKIPSMNLGYRMLEPQAPVAITFYATLDPPLHPPPEKEDNSTSSVDEILTIKCKQWLKELNKNADIAARNITILAPSSSGRTIFVTRYICPGGQTLPPTCENEQQALRYVSLVPFVEDADDEGDQVEMWQTSQEFLETQAGDWEEHAILLCNYFLKLKPERAAYVVIGIAIPEGASAYVLAVEADGSKIIYNPCDGNSYRTTDHNCPLRDISYVFNAKNVWANLQQKTNVITSVKLDFEKVGEWRPFFNDVRVACQSHALKLSHTC
jgi:coiled-coil and C2 domain-containing protein 2A